MKRKYVLAGLLSVAMASSAMAQSSTSTSGTATTGGATAPMQMTEAEKSTTSKWTGPIADAFFTDATKATLRSQEEIKSKWSALSAEQKAQVKQDCNAMKTASAATGGTATTGSGAATTDTTASADTATGGTAGTSKETTASTTTGTTTGATAGTSGAATGSSPMTVAQLCGMVESM
jgi:hypothetical protein